MGNRHSSHDDYQELSSEGVSDFVPVDDLFESIGYPEAIETFQTGFFLRNPIEEDYVIRKYGKYIYERYIYPNEVVYVLMYHGRKYAWGSQVIIDI